MANSPEKQFKIKDPDDFFLGKIFTSPKARKAFHNLTMIRSKLVITHISPVDLSQLQKEGKGILNTVSFNGGINGGFFHFFPQDYAEAYGDQLNAGFREFSYSLFYPVVPLIEEWSGDAVDYSIDNSRTVDMSTVKGKPSSLFLKARFRLQQNGAYNDFFAVYFRQGYIRNLGSLIAGSIPAVKTKKELMNVVIYINKAFKTLLNENKLDLSPLEIESARKDDTPVLFRSKYIEFEDFLRLDSNSVRIILDELTGRNFSAKNLAIALSKSTDELKNLFYRNMSMKRRQEIAEGAFIWDASREEILKHQRTIIFTVIDLLNQKRLKIDEDLKKKIKLLEKEARQEAKREAEEFIESKKFDEAVLPLTNRQMQLLIRRVNRKSLLAALQDTNKEVKRKFFTNMTNDALDLLKEDMAIWKREQTSQIEALISTADSQKKIAGECKKLLREDRINQAAESQQRYKRIEKDLVEESA